MYIREHGREGKRVGGERGEVWGYWGRESFSYVKSVLSSLHSTTVSSLSRSVCVVCLMSRTRSFARDKK